MNAKQGTSPESREAEGVYPIRTVAALTGVNPVTLRAWERRYGLICPQRTETGRRIYSRADIDLIHRIIALTDQGVAIGQVSGMLSRLEQTPADIWEGYRDRLLAAIVRYDQERLEDTYDEIIALHPVAVVTREVLIPLLRTLGQRWSTGEGRVADEHFFSVFLRNKLGARLHHLTRRSQGRQLVAACLPGESHELGLLLFALAATERGYRILLLGPNMPIAELAAVAATVDASAIILAGCVSVISGDVFKQLQHLAQAAMCPVLVGGAATADASDKIARAGARVLGEDYDTAVDKLPALLASA